MDARADKFTRMTTQPVKKLVLRLAGPTIASMLISSLYNMADTFFVGRIGTFATAGVGLIFPLMTVMQAFGFFFGQGSGNYVSRALGANRIEDAERMAATGFFCALGMGALIFGLGQVFSTPVLRVLGADPGRVAQETVDHARAYLLHDRSRVRGSAEHRPRPPVHLRVQHGRHGRRRRHGGEPGVQLLRAVFGDPPERHPEDQGEEPDPQRPLPQEHPGRGPALPAPPGLRQRSSRTSWPGACPPCSARASAA